MKTKTYNHLACRVEYPLEQGYRIESKQLPDWIHLTVTTKGDSKWLTVHSRIHVNKTVRINPTYSADFSDAEIIKDLSGVIAHRFL